MSSFNILLVCTGNTCRSPMAEGILKSMFTEKNIKNINVRSAGTAGLQGLPASGFAVEAAKNWNVDISNHRSAALDQELINSADLILALSSNHVDLILKNVPGAKSKTYLIKGFPKPYSQSQEGVYDPIGGPLEQYNQTYLELDEKIRQIIVDILKLASSSEESANG